MNHSSLTAIGLAAVLGLSLGTANAGGGINALTALSQQKAQNANDEAQQGADRQRELVNKQKQLRERQKSLESQDRLGNFEIQQLTSRHNQNQATQSAVRKKHDDTSNAVLQKVR